MGRRTGFATVLMVALALAGCNGFSLGGDGAPEPTLTPAAVPTDAPTPTPVTRLAPGVTEAGVTNPAALAEAHAAALAGTAYAVREERVVRYANGTTHTRRTTNGEFGTTGTRFSVARNVSGATVRARGVVRSGLWSDGERVLVARTANGTTSYFAPAAFDEGPIPARRALSFDPTNRERIAALFGAVETRVVAETTRSGTTIYRVEGTDVTSPIPFEDEWDDPQNVTLQASVGPQGLVREYRLHYTATLNDSTVRVRQRVRYTGVGNTAVERPSWYDDALENVSTATPAG